MLTEIRCEQFGKKIRIIQFNPGLNLIVSPESKESALGKTTFLRILDFVFGGNINRHQMTDIREHVGDLTIYFRFKFNNELFNFCRSTQKPEELISCDDAFKPQRQIRLEDFKLWLQKQYAIPVSIDDIRNHFFRIHGSANTDENRPLQGKVGEKSIQSINFLINLFEKGKILEELQEIQKDLGTGGREIFSSDNLIELKSITHQIENLHIDLNFLIENHGKQLMLASIGLTPINLKEIEELAAEISALKRERRITIQKIQTATSRIEISERPILEDDFNELLDFFPEADLRPLKEIESFHRSICEIRRQEDIEELESARLHLAEIESALEKAVSSITSLGMSDDISQKIIGRCRQLQTELDKLEARHSELIQMKKKYESNLKRREQLEDLKLERKGIIDKITEQINADMKTLHLVINSEKGLAPVLRIDSNNQYTIETDGNTSQSASVKGMIFYDLALLKQTALPVIIYDGKILYGMDRQSVEKIMDYISSVETQKQLFFVVHSDVVSKNTSDIILRLTKDEKLYGKSWNADIGGFKQLDLPL